MENKNRNNKFWKNLDKIWQGQNLNKSLNNSMIIMILLLKDIHL